ncbi:hypothetical protein KC19_4G116600 [Ceratodon purpureus]|uniref:F-box domain-containing protein n=1 Tax=Ceratodon purpureus TaxID=3225 RepID=A0A8T0I844_CERPU|nr:hypothetical protein KC19_4G116600 [Ceratodon purpureus]
MAPRPSRNLKEDATVLGDMKDDVAMDPTLWGNLKDYVAMEIIYAKVPFHKFFQLRLVCKEWNHLAGDRKFLEDHFKEYLVPEPYFYIPGGCEYLDPRPYLELPNGRCMNGFVTIDINSEDVGWIGLNNPWKDRGGCCAVNGLIYSETVPSPDYLSPPKRTPEVVQKRAESRRQEVFNIHTRVRHKLPPSQLTTAIPVVGMLVDTSVRPYGFKVIQGCGDLGTQIFDSRTNAWELRPSRLPAGIAARLDSFRSGSPHWSYHGSVNCNGLLFIACDDGDKILVYNEKEDIWSTLYASRRDAWWSFLSIGSWHGRLFKAYRVIDGIDLTWDLTWVNPSRHEWELYDQMPANLCDWLFKDYKFSKVVLDYCRNYILICYDLTSQEDSKTKIVLYDLATKSWKKFTFRLGR